MKEQSAGNCMKPIYEIAASIGLAEDDLECYGRYKAKVRIEAIKHF